MQVTKELLDHDIAETEKQIEALKGSLAQVSGALIVLKNIREYLAKPDPTAEKAAEELPAVALADVAENVAGPGAVVEEISSVEQGGDYIYSKVVDANGQYKPRKKRNNNVRT